MSRLHSHFIPSCDDPGPWDFTPVLTAVQQRQLLQFHTTTAQALTNTLEQDFAVAARAFGVRDFLQQLIPATVNDDNVHNALRLIAAQDYHAHRGYAPQMSPGGSTSPRNRKIWQHWQPWLQQQLLHAAQINARESLLWRCHLARMPNQWLAEKPLTAALQPLFTTDYPFAVKEMQLQLRTSIPAGNHWIIQAQQQQWQQLQQALLRQHTVIMELIRHCSQFSLFSELALVHGSTQPLPAQIELDYYDPTHHNHRLQLLQREQGLDIIDDSALRQGLADLSIKGFRIWRCAGAAPPWFGLRKHLPDILPWRLWWWLKRGWVQ